MKAGRTYEGLMRRLAIKTEDDSEQGVLARILGRVSPSKTARHQRTIKSLQAKLPLASHHQILQVLLFQELLAHQRGLVASNASFIANGRRLQTLVLHWDRLKAQDPVFESESIALSRDVDDFVEKLAGYLHPPSPAAPPSPTASSSSSSLSPDSSLNDGPDASDAPPPPPTPQGAPDGNLVISRRDAWALQRAAKSLISRTDRFHARLAAHERRKASAKGKGTACIAAIAQSGKDVSGASERVKEVVLELVILWKNSRLAAGEEEERKKKNQKAGWGQAADDKGGKRKRLVDLLALRR